MMMLMQRHLRAKYQNYMLCDLLLSGLFLICCTFTRIYAIRLQCTPSFFLVISRTIFHEPYIMHISLMCQFISSRSRIWQMCTVFCVIPERAQWIRKRIYTNGKTNKQHNVSRSPRIANKLHRNQYIKTHSKLLFTQNSNAPEFPHRMAARSMAARDWTGRCRERAHDSHCFRNQFRLVCASFSAPARVQHVHVLTCTHSFPCWRTQAQAICSAQPIPPKRPFDIERPRWGRPCDVRLIYVTVMQILNSPS